MATTARSRRLMPADYRRAPLPGKVVGSVLMEGEWDPRDPDRRWRWASEVARDHGLLSAAIGQIWLDREDVGEVVAAYREMPLVRSVRHKPKAVARDEHRPDFAVPGSMRDRSGATAMPCSPLPGSASTCRHPGGIWAKPPSSLAISPKPPSSSTMPACRPIARPRAFPPGARHWTGSPASRTSSPRSPASACPGRPGRWSCRRR